MKVQASARRVVPALAAAAGVVVAHVVDYALLFPEAHTRDAYLHSTGHGYWPLAMALASAAAAATVLLVAGGAAMHAAHTHGSADPPRAWAHLGSLAGWQAAAFVAMEVGERGLAGAGPAALLHRPEFWLGLALQAPIAWLVVKVLGRVDRAGAAVGARFGRFSRRARRPAWRPAVVGAPPVLLVRSPARPRGPPPHPLPV